MAKRRASTSEDARAYRAHGHAVAKRFALMLGLDEDYQNDRLAKKDVIDPSGDAHSVKSGQKKWQIFLYARDRFINDDGFQALNGIGTLLIHCIDIFPPDYEDYKREPGAYKKRLKTPMRELKDRLQRRALLRAFLSKAMFNAGEVDYLTAYHDNNYHVFHNRDVVESFGNSFSVENSKAKARNQVDDQKVIFKFEDVNVAELEMRNDSKAHYRRVRLNMKTPEAMNMLQIMVREVTSFNENVLVYGSAIKKFGNWNQ